MTYVATFSQYDARCDRRPVFRDLVSQAGFAFVSVSFIAAVGACLFYGRPGGTVHVGKAPELAPVKSVASTPKVRPPLKFALREVTFSLGFAPLSLGKSIPVAGNFVPAARPVQFAALETKPAPAPAAAPAPAPMVADTAAKIASAETAPAPHPRPGQNPRVAQTGTPTPSTTPADPNFFDKVFGPKLAGSSEPAGPVLAYADPQDGIVNRGNPAVASAPVIDQYTAVYDISAHTVHLPDGTKLEAHSGLRRFLDDPGHVHVKMRGATPPGVYDLKLRERIFHGVQALRLTPVGNNKLFGRDGLLAHTYMLGPRGDSNGCVVFKNYNAFLQAFRNGAVKRLAVVARKD
jgi:hypothetical protein